MTLRPFDDGSSDEARQFLLDRRCERNHPKRHRTRKRAKALSVKKRAKIKHMNATRARRLNAYKSAVRAFWRGEGDHPKDYL